MWRGSLSTRKAAVLLIHLPRGASIYRHMGGAMAITDETEASWLVEHTLRMQAWGQAPKSKRGKQPEMRAYPGPLFEGDKKKRDFEKNAEAWRRKYGKPGTLPSDQPPPP